jgi:hypothetical protein
VCVCVYVCMYVCRSESEGGRGVCMCVCVCVYVTETDSGRWFLLSFCNSHTHKATVGFLESGLHCIIQ